jgi:hypothetical protein
VQYLFDGEYGRCVAVCLTTLGEILTCAELSRFIIIPCSSVDRVFYFVNGIDDVFATSEGLGSQQSMFVS